MTRNQILEWQAKGCDHPMWELLRLYHAVGTRGTAQKDWVDSLVEKKKIKFNDSSTLQVSQDVIDDLRAYIDLRNVCWAYADGRLRSEEQAKSYCASLRVVPGVTATRSQDHHQASKSLVAAVTHIAKKVVLSLGTTVDSDPQTRCAWMIDNLLHVTARRLDGAAPTLINPKVIWEIKEYWGVTNGGSKMSDAVYECHLVGRELLEYYKKSNKKVGHFVFVDGKCQWTARKSDMLRLIDLNAQGLIDNLYIGKDVEEYWEDDLTQALSHV